MYIVLQLQGSGPGSLYRCTGPCFHATDVIGLGFRKLMYLLCIHVPPFGGLISPYWNGIMLMYYFVMESVKCVTAMS